MAVSFPVEPQSLSGPDLERILQSPALANIDAQRFPAQRSLRTIISEEARIRHFERGDIVVRDGDYGSSVFIMLSGTVRVLFDSEGKRLIAGRRAIQRGSLSHSITQIFRTTKIAEQRDPKVYQGLGETSVRWAEDQARTYVKDVDRVLSKYSTVSLGKGQLFGEVAALTRSPRTATVFADSKVELAEIRWQGLRELRRRDAGFRDKLDELYRSRDLSNHLKESPLFTHLDEASLTIIAQNAVLESYGELEWSQPFQQQRGETATDVVATEPLIAEEGHYVDGLLIVRSGFARVSQKVDHGQRTIAYLTANETFGLEAIVSNKLVYHESLRAVGYVDVLRVPSNIVIEHILPSLPKGLIKPVDDAKNDIAPVWSEARTKHQLEQSLLDAMVDRRVINGQSTMIVNTDRCVDCDDCVVACAATHGGNPRFLRQGPSHAELMFTSACMHCTDPVCLVGCPTGAIHRNPHDLRVLIDDPTCIGCSTCADACPYDNIRMVEVRDASGALLFDREKQANIIKATKCDLCVTQIGGPSCERACPHDALIRIDPRDRKGLAQWIDGGAKMMRNMLYFGVTLIAAIAGIALDHFWDQSFHRNNLFSGWLLLAAICALVLLGVRKKLPGIPIGKVSSWVNAHIWIGWFSIVIFSAHAGWTLPQGRFEAVTWILFFVVAVSGVIGAAIARFLPSRLGRYGERVLPDRIEHLRRDLAAEAEELADKSVHETSSSTIAEFYSSRLAPFFARPQNLLAHLVESSRPFESLRLELQHLNRYLDPAGREILAALDERVVAKANLDHQHALQLALRGWRFIHMPMTVALSGAITLHLVLALAFSGGQ